MFEDFDDPNPPTPSPIGDVVARGRRLQLHRRMVVGAAVMFVLAGTIVTATALQSGTGKKVVVSDSSTSTSVSDTTVPEGTSTTVGEATSTTVDATPTTAGAVAPVTTTTTTQPPHDPNDLSMVAVTWPTATEGQFNNCLGNGEACGNSMEIFAGSEVPIRYNVTNNGSWTVHVGECVDHFVDVWADNRNGGFGQFDLVWPAPYPARGAGEKPEVCADVLDILQPGETKAMTETVVAGYRNAAGDVMPSSVGVTAFQPSFRSQCAQPCETLLPDSLVFRVVPPITAAMPFTITIKTMRPTAASGQSTTVEMTYTNPLAFAVRTPIMGPCWTVKTGTASVDCSGKLPALIIGPHQTVDLVGTVWARDGFKAGAAPLAPGNYALPLGDQFGTATFQPQFPSPEFTVTAS